MAKPESQYSEDWQGEGGQLVLGEESTGLEPETDELGTQCRMQPEQVKVGQELEGSKQRHNVILAIVSPGVT